VCEANEITIEIDDSPPLHAAYGTTRADTAFSCGDTENGFGLTFNWNLLGAGSHTLRVLVDGDELSSVAFEVITLGSGEFQRGLVAQSSVINFPTDGQIVHVQWEESLQNFVIRGYNINTHDSDSISGSFHPHMALENPQPDSFHSGIGLISGWACEAQNITIQIDETNPLHVAHGTTRADTFSVCGDDRNGFGLPFNWNLLTAGPHTLSAYADGSKFAEVRFVVTTLGLGEFPRDLDDALGAIVNFPARGTEVRIRWQESLQNFVLDNVLSPGLDSNLCVSQEGVVASGDGQEADIEVTNSCGQQEGQEDITLGLDGSFPIQDSSKSVGSQNAVFKNTASVASQAFPFDELLEQFLTENATFLLCADEFQFWQKHAVFNAGDFQILDGHGQEIVCREFQQGERLQAIVSVREGIPLNFGTDFALYYRNELVAAFVSPLPEGPILALSVPTISFGNVAPQHNGQAHITIQNKGIGTLSGKVTAIAPFRITTGDTFEDTFHSLASEQAFTLAAGEEQTLSVQFRPPLKGLFVSSLTISSNSGAAEVHLSGNVP